MAASAASEVTDGPVLSLINKRLRALRKKYNRILQMEEGIAQGKPINKEQEEVLRSKPTVAALIDEFEKLRQPLTAALQEELKLTVQHHQVSATPHVVDDNVEDSKDGKEESGESEKGRSDGDRDESILEDLLNLLYFASLFDVKPQSDFTSTMLTRTHERGCCLTYDYVTDDATDLLGERDLDMISMLGSLLISRPVHSILSHKNALRSCVQHAKLWLSNSDQPIEPGAAVTYTGLRERLNRILASDYFTTTPEMKAPVEVAAAAGKYAPCQAPVQNSVVPSPVPVQAEGAFGHYHDKGVEDGKFIALAELIQRLDWVCSDPSKPNRCIWTPHPKGLFSYTSLCKFLCISNPSIVFLFKEVWCRPIPPKIGSGSWKGEHSGLVTKKKTLFVYLELVLLFVWVHVESPNRGGGKQHVSSGTRHQH
ncbi:PREDICTED: uncharacterized protein LOC104608055 isoform X3 [Nelumbo nucifera]|uniref:Uncharacterized protein LOC104608055 isoform X3 n=1 Tax=Nelumbo nucifera TaxID=4432 RepID=A0A1U8AW34_NELNU|nr:PREDICTED: uncharacterized protein LOC104608055 isoform X3 [Nelumbo nucifera]